jgi:hypothetical protein
MTGARHPFRLASTRQLALGDLDRHIADLVRLVLLTGPGERLHRPEFGAGLGAAVLFEPVDDALTALVKVRALGSLERELGDRIEVLDIEVGRDESTIAAQVHYRLRPAGAEQTVLVGTAAK